VRLNRVGSFLFFALLLVLAAGGLRADTLISLGASTTGGSGCALSGGATCNLSALVTGVTPATVTFDFSPTVAGAVIGTPVGPNNGLTTITYKAPSPVAARQTITVTATAVDGTKAFATITLVPPSVTVSVTPSATVTLSPGATQHFTATVFGISQTGVTWSISPAVVGTFTTNGNSADYMAPNPITSTQKITITATSTFDPTVSGSGSVQLNAASLTVSPTATVTLTAGASQLFTATLQNASASGVTWTYSPAIGTLTPNGASATYTAPSPIPLSQKITITATSSDGSLTASGSVQLNLPSVTITPSAASISTAQTQQFTAVVSNAATNNVVWSINPPVGTIDQNGLYTAPGLLTVSTKITVTATSVSDSTRSGTASVTVTPLATVGSGAPTQTMQFVFQAGFIQSGLGNFIVMPPLGNVKPFGSTGYVQEFTDLATSTAKDALVTGATSVGGVNVAFAILAPLYAYYSTVSANTAGYPLGNSQACSAQGVACQWDTFDKNYALFAYASALPNGFGPNITVNGAFYTEFTTHGGGIGGLGSVVSTTSNITGGVIVAPATTGTTATAQLFANGAIYSITSGAGRGQIFSVLQPLYDQYTSQGGPSGTLGLPSSEIYQLSSTVYKQNFEGGVLQYTVGGGTGVLLPVASVRVDGAQAGAVTLSLGQSVTLTATPVLTTGEMAPDRPVSWTTTNGQALSIQASGATAVITAIGAGAAAVQANSQGVASTKVNFIVISPCCSIGAGAPANVQQAFRDALTRNKLSVSTPLPSPAARVGAGYVQMAPAANSNAIYLLAQSDRLGTAYVIAGAILARYQELGGPAGQLGYPASDASAAGTQQFAGGALGGTPVRLVTAPVLAKWALLGYDTGAAGLPAAEAVGFDSPGANSGLLQNFSKGTIVGADSGPRAGQAYLVTGLILARYTGLGGPAGDLGMPTSDEFATGGLRQQNFEFGTITYSAGDGAAVEHASPRSPAVIAFPPAVSAGGRARLAVLGFANNSTLRVSITGSPDFVVTAANGAYRWEMAIPLSAKSATVAIHATDGKGATADGSLTIRGFNDNRVQMTIVQGDNQTGLPGSLLPKTLRVALADASNTPIAGASVTFSASSGTLISTTAARTDEDGLAEVAVRLPAAEGIAAVTATAAGIAQTPVTFYVRAAGSTLSNVPKLTMAGDTAIGRGVATIGQKGALLTAVASILRYHQNRGDLKSPNGTADPVVLNQFLTQYCTVDVKGAQVCDGFFAASAVGEQVVNLWRAAEFTGGVDVAVLAPTAAAAADTVAQGSPALLSLALSRNGAPAGGHFVVATGVAADGSIVIQDPSAYFGRTSLTDYLRGFNSAGIAWTGELRGVVQLAPRNPAATRFLAGAVSQLPDVIKALALDIRSTAGACGTPLDLLDSVDGSGTPSGGLVSRFVACDGSAPLYQVSVGAAQSYQAFVSDLATAGSTVDLSGTAPATYAATRPKLNLALAVQAASFTPDGVVNAATFAPGIAPGGIVSIFGSGLSGAGTATTVDVDGAPAAILLASAFQVNAVVPASVAPGPHVLRLKSSYGTVQQTVTVSAVAPGIFMIGDPDTGAILNPDSSLNSPSAPVARGQYLSIYATGLGAVAKQGNLSTATTPVTVVLNGQEVPASFAGLAPGFTGLYQVNVILPASMPPGLAIPLYLKQAGQASNRVLVSIQ